MRTIRCPRLLLLLLLLHLAFISITSGSPAEADFDLRSVALHVKPSNVVERGSQLMLTCDATLALSGSISPLLRFSFYRDDSQYNTIGVQSNNRTQATHTIPSARASDSGNYQCDVTAENEHRESPTQNITVKGLQTPVLHVDKRNVTLGDSVSITCSAKEETGELIFTIFVGSSQIIRKGRDGALQKSLSLTSAGTTKLSCSYRIQLLSGTLYSDVSDVVSVTVKDLYFLPSIKILPSKEVIEGDSVRVVCNVTGGHRNSGFLKLYKELVLLSTTSSLEQNLEFTTVALANDSGRYECSAIINSIEKNDYANLTVKDLFSTPALSINPADAFEKQQVNVTCTSSEFAAERIGRGDVKYSIYRNSQVLTSRDGRYTTTAGEETSGEYSCSARAKDTVKWSLPVSFTARVLVSTPSMTVHGNRNRKVILGQPFQIKCHSDMGSFPITYTLKKNHRTLNHTTVSTSSQEAVFTVTVMSEEEIGEFGCEAHNEGGVSAQTSDALRVQVIVPVKKPVLMTLPVIHDIIENDEVHFLCSAEKGTPPITFKWYRDENRSPLKTVTVMKNFSSLVIPSASGVHSGRYHCGALNDAGNEEVSDEIVVSVKMSRWKKGLITFTCLLILAALIGAVVCAIRYRANRVKVSCSKVTAIWSERPPILDIGEVVDVAEEPNVEYTEVLHPQAADPARVPLRRGTDTVYSEVQSPPPELFVEC